MFGKRIIMRASSASQMPQAKLSITLGHTRMQDYISYMHTARFHGETQLVSCDIVFMDASAFMCPCSLSRRLQLYRQGVWSSSSSLTHCIQISGTPGPVQHPAMMAGASSPHPAASLGFSGPPPSASTA